MKKTRLTALLMAAVMVLGSLTGCGGGEEPATTADGETEQVLNLTGSTPASGLNPLLNTTGPDNDIHNMICDTLVKYRAEEGNTTSIVPGSAESWDISEDGMTYTFHIRENAKWSDGVQLTAKDYEYTLKMMADPKVGATNAWLYDGVIVNFGESLYDNGKTPEDIGVKAIDDYTLEIQLVHPASYFLQLLNALYPVRQDKYEEWGDSYGSSVEKLLCSGPFQIETWNQTTEMIFVKNPNYWNAENVKLDKINSRVIGGTSALQAFLSGDIDANGTSEPNWVKLIEESGIANTTLVPGNMPEFLMFNLNNEYLSNTKIRQALAVSFDRQALVNDLCDGQGVVLNSIMPDSMMVGDTPYHELVGDQNYFVTQLQEEITDPKAWLIEGLKEMGKDPDPSQITLRYASRGTNEWSKKTAEWFKQMWETALGINVQIDMMEWNIMWDRIDAGDYDIAVAGWTPYYNEPSAVLTLFDPVNGYFDASKTGWVGEDADKFHELYEKAKFTVDDKEKAQLYLQAEELLVKGSLISPEFLYANPFFVAKTVKNYPIATNGSMDWSRVYVEK